MNRDRNILGDDFQYTIKESDNKKFLIVATKTDKSAPNIIKISKKKLEKQRTKALKRCKKRAKKICLNFIKRNCSNLSR